MASTRLRVKANGQRYYEIIVSRGRGLSRATMRWSVPDGWSDKSVQRELARVAGKFEVDVKSGAFQTKAEKKAIKEELESLQRKMPTFRNYCRDSFIPTKQHDCTTTTTEFYEAMLENILDTFGEFKLDEITPTMCKGYFLKIRKSKKTGQDYSYSFMRGQYITLHGVLEMAVDEEIIAKNPCSPKFKPQKPKDELRNDEVEYLPPSEVIRLKKCLKEESTKWQALINVLIDTGIRRGECVAIRWSKINFISGQITIDANLVKTKGGIIETTPKSHCMRSVYVTKETISLLQSLREEQHKNNLISDYVFTQDGTCLPMHPDSPTRFLTKFGDKNNFENLHPHLLRHSFASNAIQGGADIVSTSKALGHSSPDITLSIYSHANDDAVKSVSETLHDIVREA